MKETTSFIRQLPIIGMMALCTIQPLKSVAQGAAAKPNICFLLADDLRAGCLGVLAATIVNAETLPRLSPRPVSDEGVDLAGTWRFNGDADIQVPGQWVMQGFTVTTNEAAHYQRTFTVPKAWKGKRIKLRCDGVYSDAAVSINGKAAGKHLGGFTPFEFDVTDLALSDRQNTIEIAVISESLADRLACGSQYACHPLGGITRKIRLFALPETNISALRVATKRAPMKHINCNLIIASIFFGQIARKELMK